MSFVKSMAPELWLEILSHSEPKDLISLMSANPAMQRLCRDRLIWGKFCRIHYKVQPKTTFRHCFELYNQILLPYAKLQGLWLDTTTVSGDVIAVSVSAEGDIVGYNYNEDNMGYTGKPFERFRLALDSTNGSKSYANLTSRRRCPKYAFGDIHLIEDLSFTHNFGKGISQPLVALTRIPETTYASVRNHSRSASTSPRSESSVDELVGIYAYDEPDTENDTNNDEQTSNGARVRGQRLVAINRSADGKWLEAQQLLGDRVTSAGAKAFQVETTGEAIDTMAELFENNNDIEVFNGHGFATTVEAACPPLPPRSTESGPSSNSILAQQNNGAGGTDGDGQLSSSSLATSDNNGLVVIRDKTQNNRLLVWWLNTSDEPVVYTRVHLMNQLDSCRSSDGISSAGDGLSDGNSRHSAEISREQIALSA